MPTLFIAEDDTDCALLLERILRKVCPVLWRR